MGDLSKRVRRVLARNGIKPGPEAADALREIIQYWERPETDPEPAADTTEAQLNAAARRMAHDIEAALPRDVGFALLLFNWGDGGFLSWVSNAQRGDMIKAVQNWLTRVLRNN